VASWWATGHRREVDLLVLLGEGDGDLGGAALLLDLAQLLLGGRQLLAPLLVATLEAGLQAGRGRDRVEDVGEAGGPLGELDGAVAELLAAVLHRERAAELGDQVEDR
jgi:hypothetical protein